MRHAKALVAGVLIPISFAARADDISTNEWKEVGKTRGREEADLSMSDEECPHHFLGGALSYSYQEGGAIRFRLSLWKYQMLQFVSHLADGKTMAEALAAISNGV